MLLLSPSARCRFPGPQLKIQHFEMALVLPGFTDTVVPVGLDLSELQKT